jgi:crotonobetainyl-CoA:carnitine CoA-transferase CaiB-like acyl-CoA transferase
MSLPVRADGETLPQLAPAPELGEHSLEVLRDVLGLAPELIDDLVRSGALGTGR